MGNEGPGVLGAWDDRPRRRFDVDVTKAALDARSAFVLTRIDGQTSISELCDMTGLGEAETLQVLVHLRSCQLIEIDQVGPRPSAENQARVAESAIPAVATPTPIPARRRASRPAPPTGRRVKILAQFGGADPRQVLALRQMGALGNVPDMPFLQPGVKRFDGVEFDKRLLLERSVLSLEQKREILLRQANLELLDHYEFFEIEPTTDKKELKHAYFAFTKRFHPDTFFRQETGSYGPWIRSVYLHGTEVHDALQGDEGLRLTYYQVITARNSAFNAMLESERSSAQASRDAEKARVAAARRKRTSERKDALATRLEARKQTRRARTKDPVQERLERANNFYTTGMEQYQSGRFVEATSSLKLALSFDPKNEQFAKAYKRVAEKALVVRHDRIWQRAHFLESVGQRREAFAMYVEAVDVYPRPDHCAHLAEMMLSDGEDLHRAAELAQIACDDGGGNLDYLILLAQIYEKVDLVVKGISIYQKVLEIDPKHEIAKKAIRALKRR